MNALHTALTRSPSQLPTDAATYLHRIGFTDAHRVWAMLHTFDRRLAALDPEYALSPILDAISSSYDPERAFGNLYTLLLESDDAPAASIAGIITRHPDCCEALLAILAGSQSMSSLLIQNPAFLIELFGSSSWNTLRDRDALSRALSAALPPRASFDEALAALRWYRKREYLRIAVCDLLKRAETPDILRRLSDVADLCLQKAFEVCARDLEERHGKPLLDNNRPSGFSVIGMGKLGGQELNFDSDIDLLFVYDSTDGRTSRSQLSTYEYYPKLARMITDLISRITGDGLVFRVDLRLRPEGRAGDIANSVDGYRWHYEASGQPWQRQALVKARPVAGSQPVGDQFVRAIQGHVFRPDHDPIILDDINRMREKIAHALLAGGRGASHVKLGPGGIREIEFIVQGFQLVYGGFQRWPWERSTLPALAGIANRGYLSESEAASLHNAYLFLRDLENRIQMAAGRQAHEIPPDIHSQAVLARTMGFCGDTPEETAEALLARYRLHTTRVRSIYDRVFHSAM